MKGVENMKAFLKVVRNGEIYEVSFREERVFDAIDVYKYNSEAKIFKKKKVNSYIRCCVEAMAIQLGGLNRNDEAFLVQLAEYTVDMMLEAERQRKADMALKAKQEAYFAEKSL